MKQLFCLIVLLALMDDVSGQGFYNKGSIVSLTPQTIVTVPDSLVNNGTLVNNGILRISGAWINNGTYDPGTGEINFNSTQTQTINHKDQPMGKLTISGGGIKEFLANITIKSELRFESGILVSGNGAKIIIIPGAAIVGGSNSSHINGPVEHSGAGDYLFPIGNGTTYLPVAITGVTDTTTKATITLKEIVAGETLTGDVVLSSLSTKRYWHVVVGVGKLDKSKITLPVASEEALNSSVNSLVVAGSATATGPYSTLGQSGQTGTLTSGTVTSAQAPTFAFFTVAVEAGERDILVYNAVSPNEDGKNEFMRIDNIEQYPNNIVTIFNRWGDKVYEITGYDNSQKNFRGESNVSGARLSAGTYYYTVDLSNGSAKKTGYLVVR